MHILVPFFWIRRILGCWGWGPSGTLLKEQGSYSLVQYWGHRGPVLRFRCIGPGGARTPFIFLFYSIHYYLGIIAMELNWRMDMLVWLCRSWVTVSTGHVTWNHFCSGFKTARLPIMVQLGVIAEHCLSPADIFVALFNREFLQIQPAFTWWTKTKLPILFLECYNRNSK